MSNELLAEWRQKAQFFLGCDIHWFEEDRGYLSCLFSNTHTTKPGIRDTIIYLDEFPHVHCLHQSCKEEWREMNRFLRMQLTGTSSVPVSFERTKYKPQVDLLSKSRDLIIAAYEDKKRQTGDYRVCHQRFMGVMFHVTDWVWTGDPEMTGAGWLHRFGPAHGDTHPGGQFICANPLEYGCWDRTNENVRELKHLVLESDILTQDQTRAMFEFVEERMFLKLKAIVFSGNKSLHGWFEHPGQEWLDDHKSELVALGFDPHAMVPSQPVRLAGATNKKTGKVQSLLWLKN